MRPAASTTVPEPMRSVPRMRAEGCDSGMRAWRWTVEGSTRSMRPTAAFTGPTLDARPAGRKPGRETSATRAKRLLAGRAGRRSIPRDRVAPAGEERGHEGVLVRGHDGGREERAPVATPTLPDRQPSLPSGARLDERGEQRKVVGQVVQHALEIALHGPRHAPAALLGLIADVAPRGELPRHRLLEELPVSEIGRPAGPDADEVGLVQGEALGQRRYLDQPADPLRC